MPELTLRPEIVMRGRVCVASRTRGPGPILITKLAPFAKKVVDAFGDEAHDETSRAIRLPTRRHRHSCAAWILSSARVVAMSFPNDTLLLQPLSSKTDIDQARKDIRSNRCC